MGRVNLNRRVTLERAQRLSDGAGGYHVTWETLGTLWAEVQSRAGRVTSGEGGAVSVTGHRVTVRAAPVGHSSRPEPGQRFVMQTRVFRIEAVSEEDTQGMYLTCHCEEEVTP